MDKTIRILSKKHAASFGGIFNISEVAVQLPNGKQRTFYLREGDPFSIVLPFLDPETIIMVEQFRIGVNRLTLELPMGRVAGKTPEQAAVIELEEETGYKAGRIEALTSMSFAPGYSNQLAYMYIARDLVAGQQRLEDTEFITVKHIKLNTIPQLIKEGFICDGQTMATLYYYYDVFSDNT